MSLRHPLPLVHPSQLVVNHVHGRSVVQAQDAGAANGLDVLSSLLEDVQDTAERRA
jgi:hypothetical protein